MLRLTRKPLEKRIVCPKCGGSTEVVQFEKTPANRCRVGCGVWINQADLDSNRKPARIRVETVGFWPAR